ncbi:MAG TPA: S8 family serine peptidase [Pirellulaceae bacterium]|nr:S8 family serine peptidase [Pirellulaceae bacterium]
MIDRVPAIRSEIIAIDPSAASLQAVRNHGYQIVADETIEGLGTRYVTLRTPAGKSLKRALAELRRIAQHAQFAPNHLHVRSGVATGSHLPAASLAVSSVVNSPAIGIIDGGVGKTATLTNLAQQGFARGAPAPDPHATAVASLAGAVRPVRSGAPGAPLLIADIYGNDPRGGNSLALAKALGWMATRNVPVVLISLVGPPNSIVASAIKQVRARGMHVVAPVGNAGPAAPPMFPAAYPGVIAVTGVDGKNRALIEAGRGSHIDYAAPGADIFAASLDGKLVKVRGTSFAAPLVAGRLWLAGKSGDPISVLDRQAVDIGRKGDDKIFGRGLICGECR